MSGLVGCRLRITPARSNTTNFPLVHQSSCLRKSRPAHTKRPLVSQEYPSLSPPSAPPWKAAFSHLVVGCARTPHLPQGEGGPAGALLDPLIPAKHLRLVARAPRKQAGAFCLVLGVVRVPHAQIHRRLSRGLRNLTES